MTSERPLSTRISISTAAIAISTITITLLFYGYTRGFGGTGTINLKGSMGWSDYSSLLANLFLIALLIERALEIFYITPQRNPMKQELNKSLAEAASPRARSDSSEALQSFRLQTRKTCLFSAFGLGLLCGISGIQVLDVVLDTSDLAERQLALFRALDVFFTAAILGGGSAGVNNLTSLLKDYVKPEE
jgi:hypothetical protein